MPILQGLDFAKDRLLVSYRASPDPQNLTLHFELKGETQGAPITFFSIWQQMTTGMAGSDVFAPTASSATRPSGKCMAEGKLGPKEFRVVYSDVKSLAPIYMRLLVERIRGVGQAYELASLDIRGDLPADATPMSVTEREVRQWLDDPKAYPRRWPTLSFPVDEKEFAGKGISARIGFAAPPDDAGKEEVQTRILAWRNLVVNYAGADGEFVPQKLGPTLPKVVWKKAEAVASIELFQHTRGPSIDVLLNVIERMHHEVGPITHVNLTT